MNSEFKKTDTKLLIIERASELFALNGFSGTSIRDIAKAADVNVSAINYHFQNKENLYWEVFNSNSIWLESGIERIGEDSKLSVKELTIAVFDFFERENHILLNTYKIFLNHDLTANINTVELKCQGRMGPPGQDVFKVRMRRELGGDVSEEQIDWALKMIFGTLIHHGVMVKTSFFKMKMECDPSLTIESLKVAIGKMVDAAMNYIKLNKL